nr:MAG TPA: hypothetical protein [Caudoviricetes sp.]
MLCVIIDVMPTPTSYSMLTSGQPISLASK